VSDIGDLAYRCVWRGSGSSKFLIMGTGVDLSKTLGVRTITVMTSYAFPALRNTYIWVRLLYNAASYRAYIILAPLKPVTFL